METKKSVFETLNAINCNEHTETIKSPGRRPLTYLSWTWAWAEVKKLYPTATYRIVKNPDNGCIYHTDGKTAWVETIVTIEGIEQGECLPIMDNRNDSMPLEQITSRDVTDSIQRCITKAIARHGLGLYIYAGEDLPEAEKVQSNSQTQTKPQPKPQPKKEFVEDPDAPDLYLAIDELKKCKSNHSLDSTLRTWECYWDNAEFAKVGKEMREKLSKLQ